MSTGPAGHVARSTDRLHSETTRPTPLRTFLHTVDGVTIDSVYDPGGVVYDASATPSGDPVFVIAHGFTGDADRPHVRRVATAFARYGAVVTFSFRGHGASGGRSTVGDREVLDIAAVVEWARSLGHPRVITVGFSMGGSVALRHAALYGPNPPKGEPVREGSAGAATGAATDAVVSVSAPARWYYRGTAPMRRLHWLVSRPEGRLVGRYGFRTRIYHRALGPGTAVARRGGAEDRADAAPDRARRTGRLLPPRPPAHAGRRRGRPRRLWLEPGMGHAEHAAADELLARIGDWAVRPGGLA